MYNTNIGSTARVKSSKHGVPIADKLPKKHLSAQNHGFGGLERRKDQWKPEVVPDWNHVENGDRPKGWAHQRQHQQKHTVFACTINAGGIFEFFGERS